MRASLGPFRRLRSLRVSRRRSLDNPVTQAVRIAAPSPAESRSRYSEVESLLRRNEHMLLAEQQHLASRLAASEVRADRYWELLLYEIFGCESKRRRHMATVFHKRWEHLTRLKVLVSRASAALHGGNVELADRILERTSPQLGILADETTAESIASIPVLGDSDTVTGCPWAS